MLLTRGTCPQVPYFCRSRIVSTRSRVRFIRSLRPRVDKNSECAVSLSPDHRQLLAFKDKRSVMTSPTIPANVLVVEDEMVLRMRAVDIVEDAGFTAVEAVNADEALSILESRSDISLLFTDIQMPGSLDGLKLAHAVHKRWPAIKIILVSGQVNLSDAEKPTDSRFFGKPLETKQMIAEIQEMVGTGVLTIAPLEEAPLAARSGPAPLDTFPSSTTQEFLTAENGSLRLLLAQAAIDAKV